MYESRGLVEPKRSPKGTRLYSQEDVEKLRRIHEMTVDLGLNLAGVQRVLDLESEVRGMHQRIEELEVEALRAQVELAEELEERAPLLPRRARSLPEVSHGPRARGGCPLPISGTGAASGGKIKIKELWLC